METREKILEATLKVFNQKGLKFTMDDIASELSMSKKTIYMYSVIKRHCFFRWLITASTILKKANSAY